MSQVIRGQWCVKPEQHYAIIAAEFNSPITSRLAEGAVDALLRHGAEEKQITTIWVPGSFEIPTIAERLAKSGNFCAVVCLGCIIRGQTTHFEHVAQQVASGIAAVGLATGVPTIFAIITADTTEQAMDRAGLKMGNAGWNAACSAIEMADVMRQLPLPKNT
ncbi:MAG: 6,7-dimethyl-8-ribityllumazine synthase [Planctomycetes bacterium]|jgi:6,7-dimethyl-8-ribityllumazine synthase|nr:6,7-dimethyl-8-ribityllumazine synthase [Planctomycetota bacterium]